MGIYIQYIYIQKIVVLASEPVGGRSRATELPCYFFKNIPWVPKRKENMILKNVHGIFKGQENIKLKQEVCRPDFSAIYKWLSGHKKSYQKSVQTLLKITHLASRKS